MIIEKNELFDRLPPEWLEDLLPQIRALLKGSGLKVVVLDDDPTGTQTVHDITVLTRWDVPMLSGALAEPEPIVYILTNSRRYPLEEAQAMIREIAHNLLQASQLTGRRFSVVSRSDSTLRGHFPGEVDALVEALGQEIDGLLVIPFFEEGGRLTIEDVHYVAEQEMLVPSGETEYARDTSFGYKSSNLREWVGEKSLGRIKAEDVKSIDLATIRKGGVEAVAELLKQLHSGQVCIVNSASYRDMEVFVAGLLKAEADGKNFIYRTAASFVRVRGGLGPHPLLSGDRLGLSSNRTGGLIVAGSYIRKSSEQIQAVLSMPGVAGIEVSVPRLLDDAERREEVQRAGEQADEAFIHGEDVLIYTSRELVAGRDALSSLQIGQSVSDAIIEVVRGIKHRPAWVIAKGGITSSDVATRGLYIAKARVLGQILPGVPVWQTGEDSRWPGLVYVVFPGNVGGPEAIVDAVKKLRIVHSGGLS
jgi:uncharacterized protein YgbK (DUF1537 family)